MNGFADVNHCSAGVPVKTSNGSANARKILQTILRWSH